jgi:hypothetical protein
MLYVEEYELNPRDQPHCMEKGEIVPACPHGSLSLPISLSFSSVLGITTSTKEELCH